MSRGMKHELSDDEDDDQLQTQSSAGAKRPRVASSLPRSSPPPLPSDAEGEDDTPDDNANFGQAHDADEESGSGEEFEQEDEEEQSRLTQGVALLNAKTGKGKGSVAKVGVIQRVELQNFMCHTLCTVNFGPQINFLCGNNGSGKSAVLTGITIALGGNAKATNRAQKGGDLVKNGAQFAVCTVTLKNEGVDAYQRNTYGKSIIVERRITKELSGGGYKIKNSEGKTVDTKKATLDAILDHFNVQVDNPMTVLTQDQSRQFLANSSPKDKYTFFLRGTQLAQLTEEYEVIRANNEAMADALARKKEVIPELKDAYKRAKVRWVDAQAAIGQQEKLGGLKNELAWAYVGEQEDKVQRGRQILDAEAARGPEIEEAYNKYQTQVEEARNEVASIEQAQRDQTDQARDDEILALQQAIKDGTNELKERNNKFREYNGLQKQHEAAIKAFEGQIAAEKKKQERNTDSERQIVLDEVSKLEDLSSKVGIDIARTREEGKQHDDEYQKARDELQRANEEVHGAEQEANRCQDRVRHLQQSKNNPLSAYGNGVPQLQELINRQQGWTKKPVGPMGTHVKLKDAKYSSVLESFFAESLNTYLVTNDRDLQLLRKLQRQAQCNCSVVKLAADPTFNCSSGEPDGSILTVLRVLTISDPLVFQALVDQKSIEKAALVEQRALGDQLLRSNPYNVQAVYSADRFKLGGGAQSSSSMAMDAWRGQNRLSPDVASEIQAAQTRVQEVQTDVRELLGKRDAINNEMGRIYQAKLAAEGRFKKGKAEAQRIANKLEQLNEKLQQEEPSDLAALEEAIQDQIRERDSLKNQFQPWIEETQRKQSELNPLVKRMEGLKAEVAAAEKLIKKLGKMLEDRVRDARNAEDQSRKMEGKKALHLDTLAAHELEVEEFESKLEEMIEQASVICERPAVEKKKGPEKLKQEIAILEKTLKDRQKRHGATPDEIAAELANRRKVAENAMATCKELGNLITALETAYNARITRWTDFRDSISTRAKMQFLYHLSQRGFHGKLQFDHDKAKLHLRVQTDDIEAGGTQNRQKDAKSLSGGEKSFSTICLLLTMWEAVGCPIRCLDEFDVFMDGVNRRISMKMMADTAKATDDTQFILITPQSVNSQSMQWGPEVRVIKMADPERNQGTLENGHGQLSSTNFSPDTKSFELVGTLGMGKN